MKVQINAEVIDKLCDLAKLSFPESQYGKIQEDLTRMVGFASKLQELDTKNVEPLVFLLEEENVWRTDEAVENLSQAQALKHAEVKDTDYFKIPKFM